MKKTVSLYSTSCRVFRRHSRQQRQRTSRQRRRPTTSRAAKPSSPNGLPARLSRVSPLSCAARPARGPLGPRCRCCRAGKEDCRESWRGASAQGRAERRGACVAHMHADDCERGQGWQRACPPPSPPSRSTSSELAALWLRVVPRDRGLAARRCTAAGALTAPFARERRELRAPPSSFPALPEGTMPPSLCGGPPINCSRAVCISDRSSRWMLHLQNAMATCGSKTSHRRLT